MSQRNTREKTQEFFDCAKKMMKNSKMNEDTIITPDNVYQEAFRGNRETLKEIMELGHLPGSTLLGIENIKKLGQLAKEGKSCLVLSEHLSNMDVPSMFTRFYDAGEEELKELFERFIFVAGVKLNQTPLVKLYTEMFTRIVIYPIRGLHKLETDENRKAEYDLARKINMRATRKLMELRNKGHIFVLYPAGTRYREWEPSSGEGMKETMSYLNTFDYICCCSINGNNMPPKEHEDMTRESFLQDVIVFHFGPVMESKMFMSEVAKKHPQVSVEDKDAQRQLQVDEVMAQIRKLHIQTEEEYRKPLLSKLELH